MRKRRFYEIAALGLITLIQLYQHTLSLLLGPCCRFTPSCSSYAISAIKRFGITKGTLLTFKRIVKCHPFHQGGHDPVPEILKNS